MSNSKIEKALHIIETNQWNVIRCSLTGAPIGVFDSETIKETLTYYLEMNDLASPARLADDWQLYTFAAQMRPCPMMQLTLSGDGTEKFAAMLKTQKGKVQLIIYFLTRKLLIDGKNAVTSHAERNLFVAECYDTLMNYDQVKLSQYVFRLAMLESYGTTEEYWKHSKDSQRGRLFSETLLATTGEKFEGALDDVIAWFESQVARLDRVADRVKADAKMAKVANIVSNDLIQLGQQVSEQRAQAAITALRKKTQELYGDTAGRTITRKLSQKQYKSRFQKPKGTAGRKRTQVKVSQQARKVTASLLAGIKMPSLKAEGDK